MNIKECKAGMTVRAKKNISASVSEGDEVKIIYAQEYPPFIDIDNGDVIVPERSPEHFEKVEGGKLMYIIQVKRDPNMENFVDMAEEEKPAAAKQRMKQLVGEYQSEGRIVEVKAEAKMEYNDYFKEEIENKKEELEINTVDPDSFIKSLKETKINKSPCKGEICAHYNDGECESFDNINDPIVNNEGECQGFKPGGKEYILNEIKRVSEFLDKTPSMGDMAANTDIDRNQYYRLFDGYKDACKQAGLTPNKAGK